MSRWINRCVPMFAAALGAAAMAFGGETHVVGVGPNTYNPAHITIAVGDTVHWTWISGIHNVVSGEPGEADGLFGSSFNPPDGYSFTFSQAFVDANPRPDNRYPYYCSPHWQQGMVGSVTVKVPEPACPADLNDSGAVDVQDLLILLSAWGPCPARGNCDADLNGSGAVDVQDLLILLSAWGPCPS